MKKTFGFIALLIVAASLGCKKGGDDDPNYVPPVVTPFSYKVDGIKDTSVERLGQVIEFINVKYLQGTREDVKISVTGLPETITDSISPASGQPSYICAIAFRANKAAEGSYPLTITASSRSTTPQVYHMTLNVRPYSNYALAFNGDYQESHACSKSGDDAFPVYIFPEVKAINRINIKGFWTKTWTTVVYADLNPDTKTINIPSQTIDHVEYKGIGTFNDQEIVVNYTVKDDIGVVNESCTATFSQK